MSGVRAVTRDDLPAVAELLARASSEVPDVERLERQLALVLFHHPWPDAALPSLLAEDDTGKIQAFLGVIPRPMRLGDRAVHAATAVRLTIHPDCRDFVGTRLLRRFLGGSQELSLMDGGGCATRAVWERLGGFAGYAYGLSWTRPLRPASWTLARLGRWLGPAAVVARPVARIVDGALARASASPFRLPERGLERREVAGDEWLACMDRLSRRALRASYDAVSLRWVLARAAERVGAPVARVAVYGKGDALRGFYLLAAPPGGVAHVMQMAAAADTTAADEVIREIVCDAFMRGCVAVRGRVDPRFTLDLTDRGALLHATPAGMLVHARDAALMRQVERGQAWLGPLDGESWLPL
jgi:hypothetical protein